MIVVGRLNHNLVSTRAGIHNAHEQKVTNYYNGEEAWIAK